MYKSFVIHQIEKDKKYILYQNIDYTKKNQTNFLAFNIPDTTPLRCF